MMETNNTRKIDQGLNIIDLTKYLASKWVYYVIAIAICIALAWHKCATSPLVYFRSATIIIKDPSNKASSGGLDRFDNVVNKVSLSNELLQFRSKRLMRDVVARVHSDVNYEVHKNLRHIELYNTTPVRVTFDSVMAERHISFKIKILDAKHIEVSDIFGMPGAQAKYKGQNLQCIQIGSETLQFFFTEAYNRSWYGKEILVSKLPASAVASRYLANFGVMQEESDGTIMRLSMKDFNGTRAEDMLNMLITVYNEDAINDKQRVSVNTADFINERLVIIEKELGGVEDELQTFKQDNQILDIGSAAGQYMGEAQQYDAQAQAMATQLKVASYIKDYLTNPAHASDLIPANMGVNDANIDGQINQYNSLRLKRDKLIDDSSEANPVVEELNNSLHALRQSIIRSLDNMIVGINVKRNDATHRQMQAQYRISSIPVKEREMTNISRQKGIKEQLYLFLLNRREENALSQAMVDNNAKLIDSAEGPGSPISPNRPQLLLLGGLIGFAIPTVFFLFILFMDTRVHSRRDLKGLTKVPYLGDIPTVKNHNRKAKKKRLHADLVVNEQENDIITEAFRMVRSNIEFMSKRDKPAKVITFTSFNPGAGKTFISYNLAMTLVFSKKRVIMVDLDIRKGSLTAQLPHASYGITNYLSDASVTIDDIINHTENENLDYIAMGTMAPNAAELLLDEQLDVLINELRQRYDYVIVDNVPVGAVADATISNRISDLTIFVARAGRLDRRQVPELDDLYNEHKLSNMALLLNGVDPNRHGYGYGYGYGYGHKRKKRSLWHKIKKLFRIRR